MPGSRARSLAAEGLGTALLLAAVVGSGIMGERLSGGNVAVALLANTVATGAALVALILTFGPISGAHFNPRDPRGSLARRPSVETRWPATCQPQVGGALLGVAVAHLMFEEPLYSLSRHVRQGPASS